MFRGSKFYYVSAAGIVLLNVGLWTRGQSAVEVPLSAHYLGPDDNPPCAGTSTTVSTIDGVIADTRMLLDARSGLTAINDPPRGTEESSDDP